MSDAFSQCFVAVYPRQVIANLVKNSKKDISFTRFKDTYRSPHIAPQMFSLHLSQQPLQEIQNLLTRIKQSSFGTVSEICNPGEANHLADRDNTIVSWLSY